MTSTDTSSNLTDVRRAFRLISMYNRATFDIASQIIERCDVKFFQWKPINVEMPAKTFQNPLEAWAWDLIPSYNYSVFLLNGSDSLVKPRRWMMEINFQADDGYSLVGELEPYATSFRAAQDCRSTLSLALWVNSRAIRSSWDDYTHLTYKRMLGDLREYERAGIELYSLQRDVGSMTCKESVDIVADEFINLCLEKAGITIRQSGV